MINRLIYKIYKRFGFWNTINIALVVFSIVLLTIALFQLLIPISLKQTNSWTENISDVNTNNNISEIPQMAVETQPIAYHHGMFKPATEIQDRPLADKTIERIRDLTLQCIMEINGQTVAYINIQGMGLRQCHIGENVKDLFTVLDINQQNKSVDISIVDHKVTLQ